MQGEVLIAGAGGVGRMFAIESARHGARVTLAVRHSGMEKACGLKKEMEETIPGRGSTGNCFRRAAKRGYLLPLADQRHPRGDVPEGGRHAAGPSGAASM